MERGGGLLISRPHILNIPHSGKLVNKFFSLIYYIIILALRPQSEDAKIAKEEKKIKKI